MNNYSELHLGDHDCPFCKRDELAVIFETSYFLAIYNKFAIVPGHSLLITKRHVTKYLDLDPEESKELFFATRKLISAVMRAYDTETFDFALQEGVPAGQTIRHLHFHVIPRKIDDLGSPDQWYPELLKQKFEHKKSAKKQVPWSEMLKEAHRIGLVASDEEM